MKLRFVILPPNSVRSRLARLAIRIGGLYPVRYIVDNKKLIPHITLFSAQISRKKFSDLIEELNGILRMIKAVKLSSKRIVTNKYGWFGVTFEPRKRISPLKREISKIINKYATEISFPYYAPHITLTKYKKVNDARKVQQQGKIAKIEFLAQEVAMALYDNFGQVYKILVKFQLK